MNHFCVSECKVKHIFPHLQIYFMFLLTVSCYLCAKRQIYGIQCTEKGLPQQACGGERQLPEEEHAGQGERRVVRGLRTGEGQDVPGNRRRTEREERIFALPRASVARHRGRARGVEAREYGQHRRVHSKGVGTSGRDRGYRDAQLREEQAAAPDRVCRPHQARHDPRGDRPDVRGKGRPRRQSGISGNAPAPATAASRPARHPQRQ